MTTHHPRPLIVMFLNRFLEPWILTFHTSKTTKEWFESYQGTRREAIYGSLDEKKGCGNVVSLESGKDENTPEEEGTPARSLYCLFMKMEYDIPRDFTKSNTGELHTSNHSNLDLLTPLARKKDLAILTLQRKQKKSFTDKSETFISIM